MEVVCPEARRTYVLKNKQICRFCLTTLRPLSNIYGKSDKSVPLSVKIIASTSVEVFVNDGLPATVCDLCRSLVEFCHDFRKMCKDAEAAFQQFSKTGLWPMNGLQLPSLPKDTIPANEFGEENLTGQFIEIITEEEFLNQQKLLEAPPDGAAQLSEPIIIADDVKDDPPVRPKVLNKTEIGKQLDDSNTYLLTNKFGNIEIKLSDTEPENDPPAAAKKADIVGTATDCFPCPYCVRTFPLKQALDIHVLNHKRERDFECEECKRRFYSKYDLAKHMLTHTGERPFQCVVCNKAFSRSTLLHRHEKTHTNTKRFECDQCDRFFFEAAALEEHKEKRHNKDKPFQCQQCPKSFAFKQGLERHEVVHNLQQEYPCQYCDQSFNTTSKLSRHLATHAGERPYPCKFCRKSYLLSHHLTRHLRSHASSQNVDVSFRCQHCDGLDNTFATADELVAHAATHTNTNLSCGICREEFADAGKLKSHLKSHAGGDQFACEFCDLLFVSEDKLLQHLRQNHTEDQRIYEEDMAEKVKNVKKEAVGHKQKRQAENHVNEEEEDEVEGDDEVEEEVTVSKSKRMKTEDEVDYGQYLIEISAQDVVEFERKNKMRTKTNASEKRRAAAGGEAAKGEPAKEVPLKQARITEILMQIPKGVTVKKKKDAEAVKSQRTSEHEETHKVMDAKEATNPSKVVKVKQVVMSKARLEEMNKQRVVKLKEKSSK